MKKIKAIKRRSPSAVLDDEARRLAQRHEDALRRMTAEALAQAKRPAHRGSWWLALPVASVMMMLVAGLLVWQGGGQPETPAMAKIDPAALPAWVLDDSAPVTLLENIEFYAWLAEHGDDDKS
jgi:hypothetical protein